ncbi:pyridoxal phosphate-dependent decarboxylase family protein [Modicisalibacter luteus]|uniref:Pyridoxal phosphate-dependent decarboxylase family protein n=1 Tax=Modicisalibacter luteus TaxID=453962 RepID=A0ABV7M5I0_9GAMM|nr:aspartate aminotransferase family protein [Halomonas lutea]GHB07779.1 decarboxylase [Halomonas lutea]
MSHSAAPQTAIPIRFTDLTQSGLKDDQLFNARNADAYLQGMLRCVDLVRRKVSSVERPFTGILPEEMQSRFASVDLDQRLGNLDAVLGEVERLYLDDAVYFHHPHYVAHLNCPITLPSILAEAITAPINTAVETWDQSAGGTFIEQRLIDWTVQRIGLGPEGDGVFTSGGTQSNLMALLIARDHYCAGIAGHAGNKTHGLPAESGRLRILASQASHFSLQKSAALLGLGHNAIIPVACDNNYRMDSQALEREIERCRREALIPIAVVATAGTTDFGSIDPLEDVAALCRQHALWMHVDAAYGGGLLASTRRRHWLAGIESADSVSVDYHKSFFQPVSCSAFLVRDRCMLGHVTYHADYLNPASQASEGTPDLVNKSLQTTRRFDALKLWMTLRLMGADELGALFDHVIDLAHDAHRALQDDSEIEVAVAPQLSTLVFRYHPEAPVPDDVLDATNAYIRKALSRTGEAIVAATRLEGRQYLKFTLLNPETSVADLQMIAERIKHHGAAYLTRHAMTTPAHPRATRALS